MLSIEDTFRTLSTKDTLKSYLRGEKDNSHDKVGKINVFYLLEVISLGEKRTLSS